MTIDITYEPERLHILRLLGIKFILDFRPNLEEYSKGLRRNSNLFIACTLASKTLNFTFPLIREPKKRILQIGQIRKRHNALLLLACIALSRLCQCMLLPSIRFRQIQSKANQHCYLNIIRDQDGDNARSVDGCFCGLESERPDDVPGAVGDKEERIDGGAFCRATCVGGYEGHADCKGGGVKCR